MNNMGNNFIPVETFLFTIMLAVVSTVGLSEIEDGKCRPIPGFEKVIINKTTDEEPKIFLTTKRATVITYPEEIEVLVTHLQEKRYYCYSGGPGDGSTGCVYTDKVWEIPTTEMDEWYKRPEMCKVGRICPSEGSCWGSLANTYCVDKADERENWEETEALKQPEAPFHVFAYHTCSRTYRCANKKMSIPLYSNFDHKTREHFSTFSGVNGKMIRVVNGKKTKIFLEGTNYQYGIISPNVTQVDVSCFTTRKNLTTCTSVGEKSWTVSISGDCVGVTGNAIVRIPCNGKGEEANEYYMKKNQIDQAASLTDLKSVAEQLLFYSAQNEYNSAVITGDLNTVKNLVLSFLVAAMKRDPHIFGVITNSPIKSVLNQDRKTFKLTQCPHPDPKTEKDCTPLFKVDHGIWKYKDLKTSCKAPKDQNTTTINLMEYGRLSLLELTPATFRGSTSDSEGMRSFKEQMSDFITKDHSEGTIPTGWGSFDPLGFATGFEIGLRTFLSYIGGIFALIRIICMICSVTPMRRII